jgi:hypothetical protein
VTRPAAHPLWSRLPAAVRWRTLRAVLSDGAYLARWPAAGWGGPVAALAIGLLVGWRPWSDAETYTGTLFGMTLLVIVASAGAALGAWALVGYAFADFALRDHGVFRFGLSFVERVLYVTTPVVLADLLLSALLVLTPLLAVGMGRQLVARLRSSGDRRTATVLAAIGAALATLAIVWAWTHTVPTLIRPVYTWQGGQPPTDAISPLQDHGWVLLVLAAIGTAVRVAIEDAAATGPSLAAAPPYRPWPPVVSVPVRTAFTTFLLSGLFTEYWHAAVFAAVFAATLVVRAVLAHARPWVALVNRVPVLARLLVAVVVAYVVAKVVVGALWTSTTTFLPIMISAAVSLLVAAVLLPGRRSA